MKYVYDVYLSLYKLQLQNFKITNKCRTNQPNTLQ